jgi:D-glycero-D-manno-heptose 1,7-bisphosphate phosphatase
MVGDSAKDMEAALAAGVGTRVLVRTGNGKRDLLCLQEKGLDPDFVAKDLGEAVDWILLNREGRAVMTSKDGTDQRT